MATTRTSNPIVLVLGFLTTLGCGGAAATGPDASSGPDAQDGDGGTPSSRYPLIDTDQHDCFVDQFVATCPGPDADQYGQDAQYQGLQPSYLEPGDGTITDLGTGLMWQKDPGAKMTFAAAVAGAASFDLAGYHDWRLPTIKELYSLIEFSGTDPSGCATEASCTLEPFIDTGSFVFSYGDTDAGERIIDAQYASATEYVGLTMAGDATDFGVNFADGRIKGYPSGVTPMGEKTFFVMYVRGNPDYGVNDFLDNQDGTITDRATGLMWMAVDSGALGVGDQGVGGLDWAQALAFCETLSYAGYDDWRLPDAKQLQSLVDYTRSPQTTGSPAIDPRFQTTSITDEGGAQNYPFFWTSTTHASHAEAPIPGSFAVYVAFGEALGWMPGAGGYQLLDVHGAGAQRSDPKSGDPLDYPHGHGPQGDVVRIYNFARCVRSDTTTRSADRTAAPG